MEERGGGIEGGGGGPDSITSGQACIVWDGCSRTLLHVPKSDLTDVGR